jgi:hypothetical protein
MLCSLIKPIIQYEEVTTIDLLDKNTSFEVYEHVLLGIDVELCIGNINNVNKVHNVLYCPVYLVKTNNNVSKIGIIEFTPIQMSYIFDDDNNMDLDNVTILLYSFVTPQYINSIIGNESETNSTKIVIPQQQPSPPSQTLEIPTISKQPQILTQQIETNNSTESRSATATATTTKKKASLNITEINEIKLNVNGISKKSRKNRK